MLNEALTGWSFDAERRPPRTTIVAPPPEGRQSEHVEALSSWLPRVAAAIDLPPALMARYVLAPALGRSDVHGATAVEWGRYFAAMFLAVRGSIDGTGRTALTWSAALEHLTGQPGVRNLTLLAWAPALPALGLTERIRRVCPACLGSEHKQEPAYERLLWRLAPLEVCVAHGRPVALRDRCPRCDAISPVLGTWTLPGRCGACGGWLGSTEEQEPDNGASGDDAWQAYVAFQLRDLIRRGQALSEPPTPMATAVGVQLAIERTSRTMTAFAREVGYDLSTVSVWAAGRRQPSLEASLRVSALGGFSLAGFILGEVGPASESTLPQPTSFPAVPRNRIDWAVVEHSLQRALGVEPPPSLANVLKGLGVDRGEARRRLPGLTATIRDRRRAWRATELRTIRAARARAVRRTVRSLWAAGVYPSREEVQRRLLPGVWLRDPSNRTAWKDELRCLGLL